jgi:hypothetical protein
LRINLNENITINIFEDRIFKVEKISKAICIQKHPCNRNSVFPLFGIL